jgi:phosphate transport system substrate-binding protein
MGRSRFLGVGAVTAVMALAACGDSTSSTTSSAPASQPPVATPTAVAACATGTLNIDGSSAIKALVQKAADEYQAKCPGATITVAATNSSTGVTKASSGAVDIGDSDIPASLVQGVDPSTLSDNLVAIVNFAVVVNAQANLTNLTQQQLRDIFSGKVTNYKDVGGADLPIAVFERKAGSGTRYTFDKDIMQGTDETANAAQVIDTTATVVTAMQGAPGGISYVSNSSVTPASGLVALSLDGNAPTGPNIAAGKYPFFSHEHMFTKPSPALLVLSFIQYVKGSAFQTGSLTTLNYLPLTTTTNLAAVDR